MKIYSSSDVAHGLLEAIKPNRQTPTLAVIVAGADEQTLKEVHSLRLFGRDYGVNVDIFELPVDVSPSRIISLITQFNATAFISGIYVHHLPDHLDRNKIISSINRGKDVAGAIAEALGVSISRHKEVTDFPPVKVDAAQRILKDIGALTLDAYSVIIGKDPQNIGFFAANMIDAGAPVVTYSEKVPFVYAKKILQPHNIYMLLDDCKIEYLPEDFDCSSSDTPTYIVDFNKSFSWDKGEKPLDNVTYVDNTELWRVMIAIILNNAAWAGRAGY